MLDITTRLAMVELAERKLTFDASHLLPRRTVPMLFETNVSITAFVLLQFGSGAFEEDRAKRAVEAGRVPFRRRSRPNGRETYRLHFDGGLIGPVKYCHQDGKLGEPSDGDLRSLSSIANATMRQIIHDKQMCNVSKAAAVENREMGHARQRYMVSILLLYFCIFLSLTFVLFFYFTVGYSSISINDTRRPASSIISCCLY